MTKLHFIIAGERRSGSSSVYEVLKNHPEISMFHLRDYDYFIEPELFENSPPDWANIKSWQETHSAEEYQSLFSNLDGKIGQKDADLLWWKPAHKRLAETIPDAKFVFILRNPVQRAESQYFNELRKGRESLTFEEALDREKNQSLSDWEKLHLQYRERGCYVNSLEHFYQYIDNDRVKVIILEDLYTNWKDVMTELCDFLEIDTIAGMALKPIHSNKEELFERNDFSNKSYVKWVFDVWDRLTEAFIVRVSNKSRVRVRMRKTLRGFYYQSKRSEIQIRPEVYQELKTYYDPYNKKLEVLLGKKLKYW